MIKRKISPIISIILTLSLMFSIFSQSTFAVVYNNENYTFSNNCIINFSANGGVEQSALKMQSATIESIRNGLTFGSIFPDNPQNSDSHAILKNYGFYTANSSFYPIDRTSLISTYLDSMYISITGVNAETKEITSATIYPAISWSFEYSINYELNNGTNSLANPNKYVYSTGVAGFAQPTKEYSVFRGWYLDPEFTIPVTEISASDAGDKTLYAKWEETHYTLNFDPNTGTNGETEHTYVPINAKISDYLTSDIPTKTGYSFNGWIKSDGTELTDNDIMTQNGFTVYASWLANKITVKETTIKGFYGETVPENSIIVENGTGDYLFTVSENEVLPKGLTLNENGVISGNFEEAGNFETIINIKDKNSNSETTAKIIFEISKPKPTIERLPVATSINKNRKIKYSSIFGGKFLGINGEELDGTKTWKDDTITYSEYGYYEATAVFTPKDESYSPIEFELEVRVRSSDGSSSTPVITYTIRSSSSDGGKISPDGIVELYEYGNQLYTFKANSGYEISEIIIDGESYEPSEIGSKYEFKSVLENHRIHVEFEKIGSSSKKKTHFYKDNTDDEDSEEKTEISDKKNKDKKDDDITTSGEQINVGSVFNIKDKTAYIQGYTDGSFRPSNSLTRAEAAVILSKILLVQPENKTYTSNFSDVNSSDWYNNYVCFLSEQGIINGYTDGTFKPNANITRAELVALVAKALKIKGNYTNYFSDTAGMWASNSISAINSFGWIKGYTDGTFKPNANITRAETTVFLNAVLGRTPVSVSVSESKKVFNDISPNDWFYSSVIEAANLNEHTA